MSLVKSSPSYARHMDELFMEHREEIEEAERIALLERENRYLTTMKQPGETAHKTKADEDKRSR